MHGILIPKKWSSKEPCALNQVLKSLDTPLSSWSTHVRKMSTNFSTNTIYKEVLTRKHCEL